MPALNLQMTSDSESYDALHPAPRADRSVSPDVQKLSDTTKTRDRSSLKKWLEPKHRRENGDGDDVMSIVSTGDEEIPPDDPTDATFTPGSAKKRSRVSTIQKNREGSRTQSRGAQRPRAGGKTAPSTTEAALPHREPSAPSPAMVINARSKIRARIRRPMGRSAPIIASSDDEDSVSPPFESKHPAPFPMAQRPSESSAIELDNGTPQADGVADMEVFDLEAVDDDGSNDGSDPGEETYEEYLKRQSEYDCADSFINDDSELSMHSDSDTGHLSPPPPAQRCVADHAEAQKTCGGPFTERVVNRSRSPRKPYARMTTGGRPPRRLAPAQLPTAHGDDHSDDSMDTDGDSDLHATAQSSRGDTCVIRDGTVKKPVPVVAPQDETGSRNWRRYARMSTGGKPPKVLASSIPSADRVQDLFEPNAPDLRKRLSTVDVLEITDDSASDCGQVLRDHRNLSVLLLPKVSTSKRKVNSEGPALRIRDDPDHDVVEIPSEDDDFMPSTPKKRSVPRYVPDIFETPSKPSSRITSSGSVSLESKDSSSANRSTAPRERHVPASGDPQTPTGRSKRRKTSQEKPLSPWEYAEMMKAIRASRKEAKARESRLASREPLTGGASEQPAMSTAPVTDAGHPKRTDPSHDGSHVTPGTSHDSKGKRKASRSPTPPPPPVPGFEDITPEELAEILRAFRQSKASLAAVAHVGHSPGSGSPSTSHGPVPGPSSANTGAAGPPPASTVDPTHIGANTQPEFDALRNDTATARRCVRLPSKDRTYDPTLYDVVLAHTYAARPNLQKGSLVAWTNLAGRGHPLLTGFRSVLPKMSERVAYDATLFHQVGDIRNPALASPLDVVLQSVPGSGDRYHFFCDTTPPVPLLAVSCGWLERSQLRVPASTGLRQRYLTLNIQSGEWERTMGFIATASGYPELYAQLAKDCLQFSSRAQSGHTSPGASSSSTVNAPASMFKQSTATGNSRVASDSFSLPNNVTIPVYDARGHVSIDFNTVLPNLDTSFPEFPDEIPHGSFVMVGYTMAVYTANSGNRTLGCNIQWAIVLGCPSD